MYLLILASLLGLGLLSLIFLAARGAARSDRPGRLAGLLGFGGGRPRAAPAAGALPLAELASVEACAERLGQVEAKLRKLARLSAEGFHGAHAEEVRAEREMFRAYLADYAEGLAALLLRLEYRDKLDWLLPKPPEESWMDRCATLRSYLRRTYGDLSSRDWLGTGRILDGAYAEILGDLEAVEADAALAETRRLLSGESPLANAGALRTREAETLAALEARRAEFEAAFDAFLAERELE